MYINADDYLFCGKNFRSKTIPALVRFFVQPKGITRKTFIFTIFTALNSIAYSFFIF